MKRVLVPVVLLAGAAAAVPFFVGMNVKQDTIARIEFANKELQAQWGPQSGVRLVGYRGGWLSSVADVETRLVMEKPNEPPRTAVFASSITAEHGPLPGVVRGDMRSGLAVLRTEIKLADLIVSLAPLADDTAALDAVRKTLADYPPVRSELRVGFDGAGDWSVRGEPFQLLNSECCSHLSWTALTIQGKSGPNMADAKGSLAMERLELADREQSGRVVMEGLGLTFDLKRHSSGLDLGKMEWSLKGLSAAAMGQQFKMAGLTFGMETEAVDGTLRAGLTSRLDSAEGAGPDGVQRKVGWDLGFELNGLDLASATALVKGVQAMGGKVEEPANAAKLQELVMALAEQSLKRQPGVRLAPLNFSVDGQKISGEVELGLVGADLASLMANPGGVVQFLRGKARLSVPEAALATAQLDAQQADGLVQQGLIRREGANLVAEAKLEPGGKLTVNGKPMDLPPM